MKRKSSLCLRGNEIKNFHEVTTFLYRGGQPGKGDYSYLKLLGVKSVVTFRWNKRLIEQEREICRKNNLKFFSIRLNYLNPPKRNNIIEFLKIIDNPDNHSIYVHCLHGVDRTGIMVALFRIIKENWSVEDAYREMKDCGFHRIRLRPFKWKLFKFAAYIMNHRSEFELKGVECK